MIPHSQPSRTLDNQIIQQSAPLMQSHVGQVQYQPLQPPPVAHQPMMTQQQIIHHPPAQVTQIHQMPMQSSVQIIPQTSQVMYAVPNSNVIVHPLAASVPYGPQFVFPGKKGKSNIMGQVANGIKLTNNVLDLAGGISDLFG
ncbi:uncharacterized protein LOC130649028 [Hydractinia symbiolongicarpus]|uniref:uncharacterized protein LOC130649028 n=1 Tax=Hydractinia symbiolongicarpus TaxID=13093 RepID=UPI00254DCCE4|nr:uncharacterized protein LOC130649028 [Hydractinia symbiolongicarpus]